MNKFVIVIMGLVFFTGCPQAHDHVFKKRGFVNVGVQQGFGPGQEHASYIECKEGVYLYLGEWRSQVITDLGQPDSRGMTVDGIERWTYDDLKLHVFLEYDEVTGWEPF